MFCEKGSFSLSPPARAALRTFETPFEHVARTRPVTEGVRHLEDWTEVSSGTSSTARKRILTVVGVACGVGTMQSQNPQRAVGNCRVAGGNCTAVARRKL